VLQNLEVDTLPTGQQVDIIESVAEGVILNSLEHLLHTHINRLLVLRPQITPQQTIQQLATTFQLVGNAYDFSFDCSDGSRACCTEVIYYALHGRGPINFPLVKRMGAQTISADDIAQYYLKTGPATFKLVLYIEEAPNSPTHQAQIFIGQAGKAQLGKQMAQVK
jgi:hypothetical protein